MQKDTYSAMAVKQAEDKEKTDMACKRVLSSKEILAYILKGVVPEYAECSVEEIAENYIEPDEVRNDIPVAPGLTNKKGYVEGMAQEDGILGEATVFFDVKFKALLPGTECSKARFLLYVDIEAQNRYYPGYPLEKRGIYYLSRMISSQIQTISADTDYSTLQKSYSIWICLGGDIPQKERQSITRYAFSKEDIYGHSRENRQNYDLMSLILLRLGEEPTEEKTLGMLQTLFLGNMKPRERIRRLEEEYELHMSEEVEQEVVSMCTYSEMREERALARGIERGIECGIERGIERGMARGIEHGIRIYKTLLETGSVVKTAAQLDVSEQEVQHIANKFEVKLSE